MSSSLFGDTMVSIIRNIILLGSTTRKRKTNATQVCSCNRSCDSARMLSGSVWQRRDLGTFGFKDTCVLATVETQGHLQRHNNGSNIRKNRSNSSNSNNDNSEE